MKSKQANKYFLPCMTVLAVAMSQAYAAETAGITVSGEVTPKVFYFDYSGGPGSGLTQYLQSYSGQESWSGDRDDGVYADLDLNLTLYGEQGEILSLEREGFGLDNHRGSLKGGNSSIGFKGYYSHFRSNTSGTDYVIRPGTSDNPTDPAYTQPTSGFIRQFNDDSPPQVDYHVERTAYGLGVKFKPDLLGKGTSLALNLDGYNRDGKKFATWVAGNGDFVDNPLVPNSRVPERWRGYEKPVDENMGRFSLNFTASPAGMFQFAYDGSYEKFNNNARTSLIGDFAGFLDNGVTVSPGSVDTALHFIPDSTLMTHAVRFSKNFGDTAVAAGYSMSTLEQDSFLEDVGTAITDRFTGEIGTDTAFLTANHRLSPTISLAGNINYQNRDNDSSSAADGLDREVRDEWGVRIADIEALYYGLSATFRSLPVKSTLIAGWKREDSERDLEYNLITATSNIGIWPSVSLYREETVSDEIYLNWVARPMPGMTLRIVPSYIWADETALVTVPETSLNLKTALSYSMDNGMVVNAYYNFKDKENGNNSFADTAKPTGGPIVITNEYAQKADDTFNAAGVSFNLSPSDRMNASMGLDWVQNDFETYFFGTNRRRFETPIVFDPRGISSFKVDTLSLNFNGEYQASDSMKLSAGYAYSKSDGDIRTTGLEADGDPAENQNDKVDHTLQSILLGVEYGLQKSMSVRGSYIFDKYDDDAYGDLSGKAHTLMLGVSFKL